MLEVDTASNTSIIISAPETPSPTGGVSYDIGSQLTLDFNVTQSNTATGGSGMFTVWNLSAENRNKLFKDQFDMASKRYVRFSAGYWDGKELLMPMVYTGQIMSCYSYRQGVDYKTEINAIDLGIGMATGAVNETFVAGTTLKDIIKTLLQAVPGMKSITIGGLYDKVTSRGFTASGNPMEIAKELTAGKMFVANGAAYVIDNNEVVQSAFTDINADTGLLNTPRRGDAKIDVSMIFEPRLLMGQMIRLNSETLPILNGEYKVISLNHVGTISGATCGKAVTNASLLTGVSFKTVAPITGFDVGGANVGNIA